VVFGVGSCVNRPGVVDIETWEENACPPKHNLFSGNIAYLEHNTQAMAKSILLINGPNLNLLGTREPSIYGSTTLPQVVEAASTQCSRQSISFLHIQSNHEGVLIDRIHEARGHVDAIVINPGALTHTSVGLRDALVGVEIPFVEVHISNIHKREAFRHHSYLSDKAEAVICGLGTYGYEAAIEYAARHIKPKDRAQL
jgi:3-dehydroquinate dehydratase-2